MIIIHKTKLTIAENNFPISDVMNINGIFLQKLDKGVAERIQYTATDAVILIAHEHIQLLMKRSGQNCRVFKKKLGCPFYKIHCNKSSHFELSFQLNNHELFCIYYIGSIYILYYIIYNVSNYVNAKMIKITKKIDFKRKI